MTAHIGRFEQIWLDTGVISAEAKGRLLDDLLHDRIAFSAGVPIGRVYIRREADGSIGLCGRDMREEMISLETEPIAACMISGLFYVAYADEVKMV